LLVGHASFDNAHCVPSGHSVGIDAALRTGKKGQVGYVDRGAKQHFLFTFTALEQDPEVGLAALD
jgi:hypothetical protein